MKKFYIYFFSLLLLFSSIYIVNPGYDSINQTQAVSGDWNDYRQDYFGGGTELNPFIIDTPEKLGMVSYNTRNGIHLDSYFKITKGLDLSAHYFIPIAYDLKFAGTIDGAGCVLEGLTIKQGWCGIVERMYGGTIKNLGIVGAAITHNYAGGYVGSFCGYMENGSLIEQCFISDSTITTDGTCAGGIVGYSEHSNITNCYVSNTTIEGNGYCDLSVAPTHGGKGEGSPTSYYVKVNHKVFSHYTYQNYYTYEMLLGGIVTAIRYRESDFTYNVGGIIGKQGASGNVTNSYFHGTILGNKRKKNTYTYTTTLSNKPVSITLGQNEFNGAVDNYYYGSSYAFNQAVSVYAASLPESYYTLSSESNLNRVIPYAVASSATNCYYSTSSSVNGYSATYKTETELKTIASTLDSSCFVQADHINHGFPYLKQFYWENNTDSLEVRNIGAVITPNYNSKYIYGVSDNRESFLFSSEVAYLNKGHKYYISLEAYSNKPLTCDIYWGLREPYIYGQFEVGNSSKKYSTINSLPFDSGNYEIRVDNNCDYDPNCFINIRYFMIVDLTELFGAGNEPNLEFCDSHFFFNGKVVKLQ